MAKPKLFYGYRLTVSLDEVGRKVEEAEKRLGIQHTRFMTPQTHMRGKEWWMYYADVEEEIFMFKLRDGWQLGSHPPSSKKRRG